MADTTGLTVRPPTLDDVTAVGELFRIRDLATFGYPELTDEELAHDWATPGFDLEHDALVVETKDGALVAYADLLPDEPGNFFVETLAATGHEDLEPWLLDLVETRAVELSEQLGRAVSLRAPIEDSEVARAGRYEAAGYRRTRTFFRMRLEPDAPVRDHRWPAGIVPAPFDPATDAADVHALLQAAFEDHVAVARPGPFERWRYDTLEQPEFDANCWVLARESDQLVGVVVAQPDQGKGWIKTLGVRRESRRRGVAAAMLAETVRRLRSRGLSAVELGVDAASPTGATRLYERAGMRIVRRTDIHEKHVGSRKLAG